jgi:hypothetical protein
MIFFGEASLRRAIREYVAHCHSERAHQGIGNQRIESAPSGSGDVCCRERLGGLLKHDTGRRSGTMPVRGPAAEFLDRTGCDSEVAEAAAAPRATALALDWEAPRMGRA